MIGADDRRVAAGWREPNFVAVRIELDIGAEELGQLGIFPFATMRQSYPGRHKAGSGQVSAETDENGGEEFDLVTVEMAADPHITEGDANVIAARVFQRNALVCDRAITCK